MFVNQIHQKSEKAKEKIDMENSVSKARKSAGDLGSFHIFSQDPNQIKVIYYITTTSNPRIVANHLVKESLTETNRLWLIDF